MLLVKGNIYRNVTEAQAEKYFGLGYEPVEDKEPPKEKNHKKNKE